MIYKWRHFRLHLGIWPKLKLLFKPFFFSRQKKKQFRNVFNVANFIKSSIFSNGLLVINIK